MKLKVRDPEDGQYYAIECEVEDEPKRYRINFPYHVALKDELKISLNARWGQLDKAAPQKSWDVTKSPRTEFRLKVMQNCGQPGAVDPYYRYKLPIEKLDLTDRPYYEHQKPGIEFVWTRRSCELAYDMGVGKTLIIGRVMEEAQKRYGWSDKDFLYVCKNGALYQCILDFQEWKIKVHPHFMSYETMKNAVAKWKGPAPRFVVFDESTQIKSPTSQRSQQALYLANSMRQEWGDECFVVCMTGTPAPKNPADWWHQVEVSCPGFIREGSYDQFKRVLSVSEKKSQEDGNAYWKIVGWLDDERKCRICCSFAEAAVHSKEARLDGTGHPWVASTNEVKAVYHRLRALVDVKFKKDCLDMPERVYKVIRLKPTQQILNAAKLISAHASGAAQALTLLRELSDGFQYVEQAVGTKQCEMCGGSGTMKYKVDVFDGAEPEEGLKDCDECRGSCLVDITKRTTARVACPKDEVIEDLLDEHAEIGRLVIYAGFTGSVDRVTDLCLKNDWYVIRVDGRGWHGLAPGAWKPLPSGGQELYKTFRYALKEYQKVVIVAQASTGAHGLNFDVCPTIVYFSNDFNGENRQQGDERNLRGKIKETLARHGLTHVTVIDLIHLETDAFVLKNHATKRKLQSLTLGEVQAALT